MAEFWNNSKWFNQNELLFRSFFQLKCYFLLFDSGLSIYQGTSPRFLDFPSTSQPNGSTGSCWKKNIPQEMAPKFQTLHPTMYPPGDDECRGSFRINFSNPLGSSPLLLPRSAWIWTTRTMPLNMWDITMWDLNWRTKFLGRGFCFERLGACGNGEASHGSPVAP